MRQGQHGQQHEQEMEGGEEEGEEYFNFIDSLRSKATIKIYLFSIKHYMRFTKRAIEQQIISYLVDM
jgi:hypothetical protein